MTPASNRTASRPSRGAVRTPRGRSRMRPGWPAAGPNTTRTSMIGPDGRAPSTPTRRRIRTQGVDRHRQPGADTLAPSSAAVRPGRGRGRLLGAALAGTPPDGGGDLLDAG